MSGFAVSLDAFHFLRPLWLLLLPLVAALWWMVRRARSDRAPPADSLAPHLRAALTVGRMGRRRLLPIDGVALMLALAALGAAGPTWSRVPDPFAAQSPPLVIALKVTPSMEDGDVAPSRLERAKQKIRDLLEIRAGARTALVAYAGSAHIVVPMSEDPAMMPPYLEGLSPEIMPEDGNAAGAALALAAELIAQNEMPGGVLFIADTLDPADVALLEAPDAPQTAVLAMLPEGVRDRGFDLLGAVPVIAVTPDATDLRDIDRRLEAAWRRALLADSDQPWLDRGPWLAWPAALLTLVWFRRGWTMRWVILAALSLGATAPGPARADGIADWFLTPDQQGRLAYQRKDYERAAELFTDPLWRGYALYRDGQYEAAAQVLSRLDTAEAAFVQGMAQVKSRSYRDAVRSFEAVLDRDPDYPDAAANLAITQQIVTYIEETRSQSDTGEDTGIGADEVVFDNEAAQGADTEMEVAQEDGAGMMTTEQWMNTVDTRTGDFLRQRFAIEAARGPAAEPGE